MLSSIIFPELIADWFSQEETEAGANSPSWKDLEISYKTSYIQYYLNDSRDCQSKKMARVVNQFFL